MLDLLKVSKIGHRMENRNSRTMDVAIKFLSLSLLCLSLNKFCDGALIPQVAKLSPQCAYLGNDGTQMNAMQIGTKVCCMCPIGTFWQEDCNIDDPTSTDCRPCPCDGNNCSYVDYQPHNRKRCFLDTLCRPPFINVGGSPSQKSRCVCPDGTIEEEEGYCVKRPDLVTLITPTSKTTNSPATLPTTKTAERSTGPSSLVLNTTLATTASVATSTVKEIVTIRKKSDIADQSVIETTGRYIDTTVLEHGTVKNDARDPGIYVLIGFIILILLMLSLYGYCSWKRQMWSYVGKVFHADHAANPSNGGNNEPSMDQNSGQQQNDGIESSQQQLHTEEPDSDNMTEPIPDQAPLMHNRDESNHDQNVDNLESITIQGSGNINRNSAVVYRGNNPPHDFPTTSQTGIVNSIQRSEPSGDSDSGQAEHVNGIVPDVNYSANRAEQKKIVRETCLEMSEEIKKDDAVMLGRKFGLKEQEIDDIKDENSGTVNIAFKIFERVCQINSRVTLKDIHEKVEHLGYLRDIVEEKQRQQQRSSSLAPRSP